MTPPIDFEAIMDDLLEKCNPLIYFIIVSSINGVVLNSRINEDEFNKASISLDVSQLYDISKDVVDKIGLQQPEFTIIHSDNYYLLSIRILNYLLTILSLDVIDVNTVFQIINDHVAPSQES